MHNAQSKEQGAGENWLLIVEGTYMYTGEKNCDGRLQGVGNATLHVPTPCKLPS